MIAWYESAPTTPNCWHNAIRRYSSDWPSDAQVHVVVADAVPDPPVVHLPVGDEDVYCAATVMFPDQFTPPQASVVGGN